MVMSREYRITCDSCGKRIKGRVTIRLGGFILKEDYLDPASYATNRKDYCANCTLAKLEITEGE